MIKICKDAKAAKGEIESTNNAVQQILLKTELLEKDYANVNNEMKFMRSQMINGINKLNTIETSLKTLTNEKSKKLLSPLDADIIRSLRTRINTLQAKYDDIQNAFFHFKVNLKEEFKKIIRYIPEFDLDAVF